jgi:hypothetical protein
MSTTWPVFSGLASAVIILVGWSSQTMALVPTGPWRPKRGVKFPTSTKCGAAAPSQGVFARRVASGLSSARALQRRCSALGVGNPKPQLQTKWLIDQSMSVKPYRK